MQLFSSDNHNKVQPTARGKCKCCTWGDCTGSDDLSSVVSQCYSSCWGHESPYRLYYSVLIVIKLSGAWIAPLVSRKRARRSSVLCFLIKFSLSPGAPATLSFAPAKCDFLLHHRKTYTFFHCIVCITIRTCAER